MAGDAEALVGFYKTPLPIFHSNGLKLHAGRRQVRRFLELACETIVDIGATHITYRILDISERHGTDTIAALVDIYYSNSSKFLRKSRIRYFLERSEFGIRIIMVEYFEAAFGDVMFAKLI